MIPRYSNPEMEHIWTDQYKLDTWLKIEILACEANEKLGVIPKGVTKEIKKRADFDQNRILELERVTKHDVIAFLTNVAEYVGENSKYIHNGLTSSDILDTSFSLQLKQASLLIIKKLEKLLIIFKKQAIRYKDTICIGRSHGIHAEPITMGLKFALAYAEFERCLARMKLAKKEISVCKISGPVGTYSSINPKVEEYVAKKMGLLAETISTQIVPRDRHAYFFSTLALIASSIDRIATEIRHLQRTEVLEAEEFFSSGQKGSSAMPHKRNPVLSENLSGLARYIKATTASTLDNVVLWHERDISHSSVERIIGPDVTIALDFSLERLINVVDNLVLHPNNIKRNLNQLKGLHFSQNVLLKLIEKGMSRESAYSVVQKNAMKTWNKSSSKNSINFFDCLSKDKTVKNILTVKELKEIFNNKSYLKNINYIYKKVFKD